LRHLFSVQCSLSSRHRLLLSNNIFSNRINCWCCSLNNIVVVPAAYVIATAILWSLSSTDIKILFPNTTSQFLCLYLESLRHSIVGIVSTFLRHHSSPLLFDAVIIILPSQSTIKSDRRLRTRTIVTATSCTNCNREVLVFIILFSISTHASSSNNAVVYTSKVSS
jgi:hypothetical protein